MLNIQESLFLQIRKSGATNQYRNTLAIKRSEITSKIKHILNILLGKAAE